MLRRGDVVLVAFPYAELTATKVRPALVVSSVEFTSAESRLIIAGITSNVSGHRNAVSYELQNWEYAGLKKPSMVTSWLATISPELVQLRIGHLKSREMQEVELRLKVALGL